MSARIRLVLLLTRPAVAFLLAMYAALGVSSDGHDAERWLLSAVLVVVFGFLLFSVVCNDIADERIDRINLAGDRRRPLVVGTANRREMITIGVVAAVIAVGVAIPLGWPVLVVVVAGLLLSAGYSLRPVRIADRGALASLLLPACYVAVPFLVGHFAVTRSLRPADIWLLAGLYVTFIGRILLKDFRDVRGDALFGKRTFLVRHGREWTCVFSAVCLVVGAALLLAGVPHPTVELVADFVVGTAALLVLLAALRADRGHRRDELLISATAIAGRGMLLLLLAHLDMLARHWPPAGYAAVMIGLALLTAAQAVTMVRYGPVMRMTVPAALDGESAHQARDAASGARHAG